MSNTVNVHVGTLEDMGQRFTDAWHRAERGEAVSETHITFHDLPALLAALTPKRLESVAVCSPPSGPHDQGVGGRSPARLQERS